MARLIHKLSSKAHYPVSDRVWLFDLDNTLHDASHAVFSQIDQTMTTAVMKSLNLDYASATALRQRYWEQYGATMIGMQRHHGVDPIDFFALKSRL